MMADLKPYRAYKSSGQAWLGDVPQHWSVVPNRSLFAEIKDSGHPEEQMLSVTITRGIVTQKALLEGSSKKDSSNLDRSAYKLVQPGDIAYNKMRAWQGALGASSLRGIISPAYVVVRPRKRAILPGYFHHLFRTPEFAKEAERWSYGITSDMWSLRPEHFKMIYAVEPPEEEQAAIITFLSWATDRLDRAIQAKRRVIALLHEQRLAIIHSVVSRGLDSKVGLKASGMEWLGEIPRHWQMISLRMRYSVELGKMLDAKRRTGDNSIPYLRNRDVQWDSILTKDLPEMDISPSELARYTVQPGDLLVCEGGQVGRAAFWNGQLPVCGFQKALHRVRCRDSSADCPRFLFYQLEFASRLGVFVADGNENTFAHLTCEKLRRHRFAFPPLSEQKAIANYLDSTLARLKDVISRLQREMDLLREFHTRVVSDCVTGKLDVRDAASRMPHDSGLDCAEDTAEAMDNVELSEAESAA